MKPGYKQTEVGVIPEEWEVKSIRDFANIKTGPFGTLLKAYEYSGSDGVPLISVGEVGAGRFRVTEHTPLVPENVVRRLPQYVLREGDIVFGRKGAVDRSALVTEAEAGWFLGSDGISIRPTANCHSPYLAAQFQRYEIQTWLLHNAIGTTMASLNQGILSRVHIPYAPLPEQRAIAEALSDVDGLLGGLDRLIAKKRDLKQAAMQQLLTGQTRLPGFHGEWEVKRLGDVVQIKKGQLITSSTLKPGDIPVIAGGKQPAYFHASANRFGRTITISASGASAGYVALYNEPIFASDCSTISESEGYFLDFVYYQLLCKQQTIYKAQTGGAQPHIHAKDLNPILFSFPALPEQTAIATVLSEMDGELAALEQRREKTRALKQAMMQELLTGRTRLV